MSLKIIPGMHIPSETARVAHAAFPKGNAYLTLRDELETIYADSLFATLFPTRGQPAEPPGRLALVLVLQFAEGLSDRQAADAVRSRIDWKYLLGLELEDPGFDFSVLSEMRERLLRGQMEQRLLDELLERFRERGLLKERGTQRTDSTHVRAAARSLNRIECVGETLRAALNQMADLAPDWLHSWVPVAWYERYAARFEAYRFPKTDEERVQLALQIGQDGRELLTRVYAADAPTDLPFHPALEVLRRVWIQQYYQLAEQIFWRDADNLPPSEVLIQSPYDPEAHFSIKRQTEWFGYKVHVSETCDAKQPHLITHVVTTPATRQDDQMTDPIHQALAAKKLLPRDHLLDRGYVTTPLLRDSPPRYGIDMIGPAVEDNSWQAKSETGLDIACFSIDWEQHQVTCPQGQVSQFWTDHRPDPAGEPRVYVRFAAKSCQVCPVRTDCTRSRNGPRTLTFKPRAEFELLQWARQREKTPEFREAYAQRAGIEGTLSEGTRSFELRRSRYMGEAKTHLQHILIAVAINFKRFVDWLNKIPLETTRTSAFAALAKV